MKKLETDVNDELNDDKDNHEKNLVELKNKIADALDDYEAKKKKNEEDEKGAREGFMNAENGLRGFILENYNPDLKMAYSQLVETKEKKEKESLNRNAAKIERDTAKEKYERQQAAFNKHENSMKDLKYKFDMQIMASEYIAGQFKGYIAKKQNARKFKKILAPLKKVVVEKEDPKAQKGKKGR